MVRVIQKLGEPDTDGARFVVMALGRFDEGSGANHITNLQSGKWLTKEKP
jgi:hypothetical protein